MRLSKWSLVLILATFLNCYPAYCETIDAKTDVDAVRIQRGWVAPSAGYFLTDNAMRDTIAGWSEARKVADVREQALVALRAEIEAQSKDTARLLAELETEIAAERKAFRSRIRRGKIQGFAYGLVLGFGGGYLVKRNNP